MMKMLKLNCSVLLLCFGVIAQAQGQAVKVSAKLDKTSILLGDQTVLRLSAELPAKTALSFPLLADTLSAKVQIVSAGKTDTITDPAKPGILMISKGYVITSFDAGLQMVPSLIFESGGQKYATEALPLEVKEVKVDTTKAIYDIKQPLSVSYTFLDWLRDEWLRIVLAFVGLAALAGAWYYYKKVIKQKPVVKKAEPLVPAHKIALDQLNALRDKKLWQQGKVKGYYSEMTDIVRIYLEKRYQIHAQEQTSDEILTALKGMKLSAESRASLKEILLLADLVKFAKAQPVAQENEQSLDLAIRFINGTQATERITAEPLDKGTQVQSNNDKRDGNGVV
jgi:hypothetical protein